jgi:Divergent InlB B-repeat domain
VTLAATPYSGSALTGWGGACSGPGGCVVTMNSSQSVAATFAASPFVYIPFGPIPFVYSGLPFHAPYRYSGGAAVFATMIYKARFEAVIRAGAPSAAGRAGR